ncbi:MAG TPA: helix-turn-helix domain-containing protein [Candidatus Saccharimonadales bacterium]|nr:helix-turn-helix domain-containing protein [Candidatus Saccharimonadales bacterium]
MNPENANYKFSEKWSPEIEVYSFTQVPNLLLACQGHLKLKDGELVTLIHLLTFWFSHDSKVFPTITTLTKFSHKGYSTVQKRLRTLEEKGFVKRRQRLGTSNTFDLIPCVVKLYKHQLVCKNLPRKQGEYKSKLMHLPPSLVINKEDEGLTRPNITNTKVRYGSRVIIAGQDGLL